MQDPHIREAIAAIGTELGPDVLARCRALFDAEQAALAAAQSAAATDLAYGEDPRHRLDIYAPVADGPAPVLVFVHGGGFVRGDKGGTSGGGASGWSNANVGRMAARAGFLGVVVNYRLAPGHGWPAGGVDVGLAVDWLRRNAAAHGGDPARIALMGTSAGAVHVATCLQRRDTARDDIRAAILLSGLYGHTPLDRADQPYYGDVARVRHDQALLGPVAATRVPLFLACAEHDPARFQAEFVALLDARRAAHGRLPRAMIVAGHNHYSLSMHLGTRDTRLSDEIVAFLNEAFARP